MNMPARYACRVAAILLLLSATALPALAQQNTAAPSAKEQAAAALLAASDWPAALTAYGELATLEPSNPRAAFGLGVALHESGKPAEAVEHFIRASALGFQPANQATFRLARAYAKAGDAERALATLDALAAAGFINVPALAATDLDSLRSLPRFAAFEKRVNANARPCDADPNYHTFDFWIGEWDVQPTGSARPPIGSGATSIIEQQLGGCVIQENWQPRGGVGAGKSFNIYNSTSRQWEQYYVDAFGTITLYTGTFHDDGALYLEANQFASPNKIRMTFFNQGPSQVRQLGHVSTDGGKTWNVSFDLTYVRKTPR
jgi:tetratricopeptide (TPR) repeat protein